MEALCDDLNTPIAIAHMFEVVKHINNIHAGKQAISPGELTELQTWLPNIAFELLGLKAPEQATDYKKLDALMQLIIELRADARANKNWEAADKIRDQLNAAGIAVKDTKNGVEYTID